MVSIYDFYFKQQEKYKNIYGDKAIVFIQIGKFYEAYCTKTKGYTKLESLEGLLNIKYIRRDENDSKPNQFGINSVAITKNLTILIENGMTIILFDQVNNGDNIERECAGIYSPGTFISDKQINDSNYLLCVYIAEEKQLTKRSLIAIGITLIDITTGSSLIHEFYSNKYDINFGLDELIRIIQTFHPIETIIYYHPQEIDEEQINNMKLYLEIDNLRNHNLYIYHNKKGNDKLNLLNQDTFSLTFQIDYLSSIFNLPKSSVIQDLQLERRNYSTISLMIILKYISVHNVILLKNLIIPQIYYYNQHLILGNNAIEQLNVIDSNKLESFNKKIESLFDVINKTSTPMGKRLLKENLVNPLSLEKKDEINNRYNLIEELIKNDLYKKIKEELKNIYDMERLHRKMAIGMITPYEFYRLNLFYQASNKIITDVKELNIIKCDEFIEYQIKINNDLFMNKLQKYNNFDIDNSFFKKGIYPNIDKLQEKIDYIWLLINGISEYIIKLINKTKKDIDIESNEREGYYLTINKSNEKLLKEKLLEKKEKDIILINFSDYSIEIKKKDIIFKQLPKGRTKIFIPELMNHTVKLSQHISRLGVLVKKTFTKLMIDYYNQFKFIMHKITSFIANIDFLVSGAIVASDYYYCKPIIKDNDASYFEAIGLRHAIIERLNEIEYIPNDICLNKSGILLFGLNWVGKSSLMKSIGIAIILAQIGYYVPAEKFEYQPYMALYARITGNDNIFKGLSSFALEMSELDAILTRTENQGQNTLVIGDEVCRGTEDISGRAIVASALVNLSNCNSSFIFSSHLHDIQNIKEIKELKNLRLCHLKADYDKEKDCLIFNRKLIDGSGPSVYGLMVAKYLIKNTKFINRAEIIKDRLIKNEVNKNIKKSNYNKKLLVKSCYICNYYPIDNEKELETHHIHFQKNCLKNGKIIDKLYLSKNKLYNLVVLCHKCHVKVHKKNIIIKGYVNTLNGPLLDYFIDTEKNIYEQFINT